MKKIITTIAFLLFYLGLFGVEEVRLRAPQSEADASHSYFVQLLQLALDKTEEDYGAAEVIITNFNVSQGRALQELESGVHIDVDWAGTNKERENILEPIRVPLIGGLLGYRIPVIRTEDIDFFEGVTILEDLRRFKAIQGSHWPDSDILESVGLKIFRVPKFEVMYPMLINKRVDYFPRGVNEVYAEVETYGNDLLTDYDKVIIAYKFPMYFFTNKNNKELAKRIEIGLIKAIDDGSFIEFLKTHPATRNIFPLERFKDSNIIYIDNPFLPELTPINEKKLWIEL